MATSTSAARLPAERAGVPADPDLIERRAKFAAAPVDPSLKVSVGDASYGSVPCRVLRAGDAGTVLYLHGGGFRMGSPEAYLRYCSVIADATGTTVVIPRYRLAPENPFPAGLHDAVDVYEDLVSSMDGPMVIAGDSAGAGLSATVTATAIRAGLRTPDGLALLSPWLDLRCISPFYRSSPDVYFPYTAAVAAREAYLQGASADDPLVSPLLADLAGFPPTLLQVGAHEALVDDAVGLAHALAENDVSARLEVVAGRSHTWPLLFPDESDSVTTVACLTDFIISRTADRR
ncbi:alpha/beta hydrolase [Gordonia sp. HY002]|uniref:alpha/beta hydrolase n=1 Tax=Gordonia zhenghanii TaxID=2911516 RepID=UPI001EF094A8|nr:alpha/beta hydrolase [Gordonia zhenghanii]MCF8568766.1 alpha/beta hydrolase [Gordonia zhenghanii]MCF8606099.1 alpha/beta hydrolase [Gordonia zhenghanii]